MEKARFLKTRHSLRLAFLFPLNEIENFYLFIKRLSFNEITLVLLKELLLLIRPSQLMKIITTIRYKEEIN